LLKHQAQLCFSDDDDDAEQANCEGGEGRPSSASAEAKKTNEDQDDTPQLVTYSEEELQGFNKRTMVADVGFLEGNLLIAQL
jgi:hypothetical protein